MSETQRRLAIERLTKLAEECRGYFAQGDELKMNLDTHSGEHPTPVMVHGDGVARGKIDAIAAIGAEAIRRLDEPDVPGATPLVQWLTFVLSRTEDAMSGSISIRPSIPRPGEDLDPGVFGVCGGANLFEDSANAIEELLAEQTSRLGSGTIDVRGSNQQKSLDQKAQVAERDDKDVLAGPDDEPPLKFCTSQGEDRVPNGPLVGTLKELSCTLGLGDSQAGRQLRKLHNTGTVWIKQNQRGKHVWSMFFAADVTVTPPKTGMQRYHEYERALQDVRAARSSARTSSSKDN